MVTHTANGFVIGPDTARPTRFPELGYRCDGRGLWRFVAMDDGFSAIGPQYASKAELLADLPRYAAAYGCNNAE